MSEEKKKTSFFKGVKAEFNKISWPNKTTLEKQTAVVIVVSVFLGVVITIIDLIVRTGVEFIIR